MKSWSQSNQDLREKQIKNWAKYVRENNNWHKEHDLLINSIFKQAKTFNDNLLKTKEGVDIIIRRFNIENKTIIKRLKDNVKSNKSLNLIEKENNEFIEV